MPLGTLLNFILELLRRVRAPTRGTSTAKGGAQKQFSGYIVQSLLFYDFKEEYLSYYLCSLNM